MRIDKVAPFYTEQDRIQLAKYSSQLDKLLAAFTELNQEMQAAKEAENNTLLQELITRSNTLRESWVAVDRDRNEFLRQIEQRYTEAFKGDIPAILADVQEIVDAIEKEEYIANQKWRTETLKHLLEKKPTKESGDVEKNGYKAAKALSVKGWQNCYYYILDHIKVQLNALVFYSLGAGAMASKEDHIDGEAEAIAIVEAKADSFYSRPKSSKPARTLPELNYSLPVISGAETRGKLLTMPTSPTITLLYDVLGSGANLASLPDRKKKYNRNIQLEVLENGDKRRISYSKDKSTVELEIDDFRKIANKNPQTKKILTRILLKANEQAIRDGELIRDRVSFSLRELVGEGQYKNIETARQGFYNVTETLTGLKVSGAVIKGKKKQVKQGVHAVLFKAAKVDNTTCEIYLNELLNWGLITPYYTGLPDYYFQLPDRAAELLEYIFYIARQNTRKIAEQGYFTIGYRAIQYKLNLPNEIGENGRTINNPKRDIKDTIEAAIEQIKEKYCKYAPPIPADAKGADAEPDFSLLPVADYNAPIKKYLDEGYLKVSLKGDYADRFIEISQKTAAKIEAARKRRERIEDRAIAINQTKALGQEKK